MKQITAEGIDVSKGRSMIASRLPGGVIIVAPFKVNLTATELNQLVQMLHQYPGEVRIVMEHTGAYWRPVALTLVNAGFFGSVVNRVYCFIACHRTDGIDAHLHSLLFCTLSVRNEFYFLFH